MTSARLQRLIDSAKLLSRPPEEQLATLASMGVPGVVDELALNFDDDFRPFHSMVEDGEVSPATQVAAEQLDTQLQRMSGQKNAHLWTPEALRSAPEWLVVRRLASYLLEEIGSRP